MYYVVLCVQVTGGTAIHHAAENGHMESVEVLLGGGANMEIKDKVSTSDLRP